MAMSTAGASIRHEVRGIARHGTVYMLAALASKAVGFLMIPLYTHYLSTADYGRLELLDLTATLISMLAGMG
ncbi:MAG: lipopolysaccharide biosynthesis protein, partial [Phycisphaerae bacterium]